MDSSDATRARIDLRTKGYARITLDDDDATLLALALKESANFFAATEESKFRYASEDMNYGYRPLGREYSVTPDRPDMNECFTLWSDRTDLIPHADELPALSGALLAWREVLMSLLDEVFAGLVADFGGDSLVRYESASYVQVNNYVVTPPDRDLLQDKHEDGHLVTIHYATAPGLETFPDGTLTAVEPQPRDILIMPGSVLTSMTGGAIEPLYHQVRNLGIARRQAIMYFVNPQLDEPLYGWTTREGDDRSDLRDEVRNNPGMFGLPVVPTL